MANTAQAAAPPTMADRGVDPSALPKEVRDQLAELDLELSEGKLLRGDAWSRGGGGQLECVFSLFTISWAAAHPGSAAWE